MRPTTIATAALLLAGAACSSNASDDAARRTIAPGDAPDVRLTRLRAEPYSFTYHSGYVQPARLVLRDRAAWEAAWATVHATVMPRPALPAFDAGEEQLVLVALGERGSGGHTILLDSARVRDGRVEVFVTSAAPGPGCGTTAALTQPVDVARMARVDLPVVFRERAVTTDCR